MKIGMLGGTFNPIHAGHVHIAKTVAERLGLDWVLLIPAGNPPHKSENLATAKHRLEMVQLAVEGEEGVIPSDVEINRSGPSYTIDTVMEIQELFGPEHDYYFIIGADTLRELPTWRKADELMRLCHFVTVSRPGESLKIPPKVVKKLGDEAAAHLADHVIETEGVDISSTEIRRRLAQGDPIDSIISTKVFDYIRTHKLYNFEALD